MVIFLFYVFSIILTIMKSIKWLLILQRSVVIYLRSRQPLSNLSILLPLDWAKIYIFIDNKLKQEINFSHLINSFYNYLPKKKLKNLFMSTFMQWILIILLATMNWLYIFDFISKGLHLLDFFEKIIGCVNIIYYDGFIWILTFNCKLTKVFNQDLNLHLFKRVMSSQSQREAQSKSHSMVCWTETLA